MHRIRRASRREAILLGVTVALATAVGCDDPPRPGGPTGPQGNDGGPGPPLLRIVQPASGQAFARTEFTHEPGVRLVASGETPPRHRVVVEAYQNNHALPFSTHVILFEEGSPGPLEFFLVGSEQHLATATAATLYVDVKATTGRIVSRDSVVLVVR